MDTPEIIEYLELLDSKIIAAIIIAVISFVIGILNYFVSKKMLTEKRIEEKRKEIYKKLNDFYGPFQSLLNKNTELYKIFSDNKPTDFRTLTYLLDREQLYNINGEMSKVTLTSAEERLLKEIMAICGKLEDLIYTKAGLIDDKELRYNYIPDTSVTDIQLQKIDDVHENVGLLSLAATHFKVINMAYSGALVGKELIPNLKNYVFPRELHKKIEGNITRLQKELEILNT